MKWRVKKEKGWSESVKMTNKKTKRPKINQEKSEDLEKLFKQVNLMLLSNSSLLLIFFNPCTFYLYQIHLALTLLFTS